MKNEETHRRGAARLRTVWTTSPWLAEKKKSGAGVVSFRTRRGCSIWQSGEARRLPAGNESAAFTVLSPD